MEKKKTVYMIIIAYILDLQLSYWIGFEIVSSIIYTEIK